MSSRCMSLLPRTTLHSDSEHYQCNYGSRLVLHWHVKSEVSVQMWTFMNYSACWRSKEVLVCTFDFTHLTFRQNRVIIVSSVIAKIFNPSKYWMVTSQLPLNGTVFNRCLLLFISSYLLLNFCLVPFVQFSVYSMPCFCSIQIFYSVQIIRCMFCPDPWNVFQVFRSRKTSIIMQSINIIHQTAPSFVLV